MVKVRDCVLRMSAYIPGEAPEDDSVVKLNQNENRYPPSPRVAEAVQRMASSLPLYPDSTSAGLRRAAAGVYGIDPNQVMAANGSDEMLRIFFQGLCDPGDEVVGFYPSYTYYATLAAMQDVNYRLVDFDGEYAIPQKLSLENARLVFLPNPNAPTGTLFPESEIRRLVEAVPDALVVIDEAYADFSGRTAIPLIREYDNVAVVRTFSKSYSLAGLRVGLGFAPKELLAQLEKVRDYYNLDRLAQAAAEAALLDQDWLKRTAGRVVATRERAIKAVTALGLKVYPSAANFILVRCRGREQAEHIFQRLRERKVLIRYFRNRGIEDCLRISIGTDADMDVFLSELEQVL